MFACWEWWNKYASFVLKQVKKYSSGILMSHNVQGLVRKLVTRGGTKSAELFNVVCGVYCTRLRHPTRTQMKNAATPWQNWCGHFLSNRLPSTASMPLFLLEKEMMGWTHYRCEKTGLGLPLSLGIVYFRGYFKCWGVQCAATFLWQHAEAHEPTAVSAVAKVLCVQWQQCEMFIRDRFLCLFIFNFSGSSVFK